MPVKAIVWDVDDTLFDHTSADREGLRSHLVAEGELAAHHSGEEALSRWREIGEEQWIRHAAGEVDYPTLRRDRTRVFVGRAGLTNAEADAWFERYLTHYESAWSLFPDVVPALDALAGDYRHGVLSNSSIRVQDRKLRTLGVHDRFESILCAAELGVSKPDASAFHAACAALGLAPDEVAYVGDHPEIDGRGAAEAGLLSVWVDRGGPRSAITPGAGALRIATLAELPALLCADTRFGAPSTFG